MCNNLKPIQESPITISSAMSTNAQGILGPHPRTEQPWSPSPFHSSSPIIMVACNSCLVNSNHLRH